MCPKAPQLLIERERRRPPLCVSDIDIALKHFERAMSAQNLEGSQCDALLRSRCKRGSAERVRAGPLDAERQTGSPQCHINSLAS